MAKETPRGTFTGRNGQLRYRRDIMPHGMFSVKGTRSGLGILSPL